ncbi:MAG: lipopolysaccharide heptosyltransferase II [Verrucomicrobia bacterium]|nr:lipopolysaccharide heptosyltransferase II [Verrucomicrobiota bacterium]MCH8528537.1 lipopolysaccharide heptosyltransferase II [Kiritimatiellia bacterium]
MNNPGTRVLVIGPNWLGDGVMAMPALQVLRERLHPEAALDLGVKPGQAGLWAMHNALGKLLPLPPATRNLPENIRSLTSGGYTHVIFIPNSFRSALAPTLAGIPVRRGTAAQGRRLLINDPVTPDTRPDRHQQWENLDLLLPDTPPASLPPPHLTAPAQAAADVRALIQNAPRPRLALIPGAARGPSKRWPAERFLAVARAWIEEKQGSALWLGTPDDAALCEDLHRQLPGANSMNLAGKTKLPEFAALLQESDRVVANDSGGMHLAAALGTPVVAIFGLTSPLKTGPLHPAAVVVQNADTFDRAVARDSAAARAALEAVSAREVIEHVLAIPLSKG